MAKRSSFLAIKPPTSCAARPGERDAPEDEADESADPVGAGRGDAELAASLPPQPGRPNPEPDPPPDHRPIPDDGGAPAPDDDSRRHQPGRDPALRRRA